MCLCYEEKKANLRNYMKELAGEDICLAFSGGVDSSLLLALACEASRGTGHRVYGVTFNTRLQPAKDLTLARELTREWGALHEVIELDELTQPEILKNPPHRCYLCKKMLFEKLLAFAGEKGISRVIEGTNIDDHKVYRPGLKAIRELSVESPLAMYEFTKEEVRAFARELGVKVYDRPSTPCLATRIPYGDFLDDKVLRRIERGEEWLGRQGYGNLRLRVHGEILRIEVEPDVFPEILENRQKIIHEMKKMGFSYITMDLAGFRSGSMDEVLP